MLCLKYSIVKNKLIFPLKEFIKCILSLIGTGGSDHDDSFYFFTRYLGSYCNISVYRRAVYGLQ